MIYAYLRVSTDDQDTANQRMGVEAKARALGLAIDKYIIDDGISGTVEPNKRKLGKLLKQIQPGEVIIVSELSRFGRRLFMLFDILKRLLDKNVRVYSVKDGYSLDESLQSKVLAFAFGMAAEIERDMISQRTKEALAHRRAQGKRLGRTPGARNSKHKLDGTDERIKQEMLNRTTKVKLARMLKVSIPTLNKYISDNNIMIDK